MRVALGIGVLFGMGLAALALFMVMPLGAPPPAALGAPGPGLPGGAAVADAGVEDGRLLYIQNCATCHGAAGEGTDVAPPLTSSGPAALDFYMRTGRMPLARPGLPPWEQPPTLSADQIAAIINYAGDFSKGPPIPAIVTEQADVSRGWQLYVNNCAACHGASANGGSVGQDVTAPSLAGRDTLTIAEALLIGPGPMPRFDLGQQDVADISAFIDYVNGRPAPGGFPLQGSGPVPEGLLAGVVGVALLVWLTRWVARNDRLRRHLP